MSTTLTDELRRGGTPVEHASRCERERLIVSDLGPTSGMAPKAPSVPQKPEVSINGHLHRRADHRGFSEACSCGWELTDETDVMRQPITWLEHVVCEITHVENTTTNEIARIRKQREEGQ